MLLNILMIVSIILFTIIIHGGITSKNHLVNRNHSFNNAIEGFSDMETIFVSVPSYRDTDCKNTLQNLFTKAKNPELIYVGVFEQNDLTNQDEMCSVEEKYRNNVRYKRVSYTEAKGPFYARAVINNNLYQGEKYYLMIDAHTLFLPNWDERMKNQLNYLRNNGVSKPIISSYPHHQDFKQNSEIQDEKRNITTLICDIKDSKSYPTITMALEKPSGNFYRGYLLGAGYIFTYGEFFQEITLDESLEHIFNGEEIMLAILAYTHGWDIYSPAYMNLFHFYNHKKPHWIIDNSKDSSVQEREKGSYDRLQQFMDTDTNHSYMGKVRNICDFWKELGFDRHKKNLSEQFPNESRELRCNKTPVISYPVIEQFKCCYR